MNLKKLYEKYKDIIPYLFFGACTTAVNIGVYWISEHLFHAGVMPSTVIAWIIAVLFAYVTNRKWVFHSNTNTTKAIIAEMVSFFACRIATGIIDWSIMYIFVDRLHMNDMIIKTAANIVVIALNYVASKLVIFKSGN